MKHINLRVPDDLHARLIEATQQNHRSLNGEILWLLEQALDEKDADR